MALIDDMLDKKQAVRVRITQGPEPTLIGRIGYLFDYSDEPDLRGYYIVTINAEEIKRVAVRDGYQYEIAEL